MIQTHDVNQEQIERLCAGYRAGIEEPAFDAADQALLRAAARSARYRSLRRRLYAPGTLAMTALLAVLGAALAGWLALPAAHQPATPAATPIARNDGTAAAVLRLTAMHATSAQAVPAAAFSSRSSIVDLNAPGALAALQASHPEDYARIMTILTGITQHPQPDVPRWLQTVFGARGVVYQPLWLTSFPPKRRLSFSLENRRYRAVLTITDQGARLFSVDGAPR